MNKEKFAKSQTVRYLGVGLAGAILAGGVTFGIMHNSSGDIENVSARGAKASSSDMWHSLNDLPAGWKSSVTSMETEDKLAYHQGEIYASNESNTCSFIVNKSDFPAHEFKGVGVDYLTQQRVLSYGENREAVDATLETVPVKTSAGDIPFWASTFTIDYDVDGDGKNEKMKEMRLAHGYEEIKDKDGVIPVTEITYSCNSVEEWSNEQLETLLNGLELNISGDESPAIPSPEVVNPDDNVTNEMPDEELEEKPEDKSKDK